MPLSFPALQELTSVHAALKWLLGEQEDAERDILAAARAAGLILSEESSHWKADGDLVTRLVEQALPRLPDEAAVLGVLLHGLGEIAAHCHAPYLLTLLINRLRAGRDRSSLPAIFNAVVECDGVFPRQTQADDIALAQWVTHSKLDWNTFQSAVFRIGHPDRVFGRFGLKFAARVFLCVDPSIVDKWIAEHPDHPTVSIIGSAALSMVFPFDGHAAADALLVSTNVALKCLGAAALIFPIGQQTPPNIRSCAKILVEAGFSSGDVTWMVGMCLKNAVHARYRIEHALKQNAGRLRYLEQYPDKAMGGIHNAKAEIAGLRRQLDQTDEAHAKLLPELEQLLVDIAADWPAEGLSDEQMQSLEFTFVDTAEVRYRLAAKLTLKADRDRLLRYNVNQLQDFVGLKSKPEDISSQHFLPEESKFTALAEWAAQSLVLLYQDDHRGIGKRTSDLVSGAAEAAERLIAQPFISARQPEAWQSKVTRAACAYRFTFAVIARTPEDQRSKVMRLNELVLQHTFILLSARNLPEQSATSFYRLIVQAVQHLQLAPNAEELRTSWVLAETLPDFARALALWASPGLVEKHEELARDLFGRVCVPSLSRRRFDLQMSRMLTLLDMAIASCARVDKSDLILNVQQLWKAGYRQWLPISSRWEASADRFALAVAGNTAARADLISDESFANTHCRRLLEANQATPASTTDSSA